MRGRSRVGTKQTRAVVVLVLVVGLLATGCVGVIDRDEFDAIVDGRGGGLSTDLVTAALAAVGAQVGTDDLELTSISVNPGSRSVVMTVRDPIARDNLDRWLYTAQRGAVGPEPVRVRANDDLDADSFLVSETPALVRTEAMADAAFAALGFDGPSVESMFAHRVLGEVRITMSVESARASGRAEFDGDGTLLEAVRS